MKGEITGRRSICTKVIVLALAFAPALSTRAQQADKSMDGRGFGGDAGFDQGRLQVCRDDGGSEDRDCCVFNDRDFYVSHVSTVPANAGEEVKLFVRERGNSCGPPVLMLTGATQPAMVPFDLPYQDYSWMTYLANAGFDVFAMDIQGYGLSTRPVPMDDPCNATTTVQASLLIPNALKETCPPSYPYQLTTAQSEWDEIDSVVSHILTARHRERLSLVGWSRGGPRAGGYAAQHPERVERLFLYAPVYNRTELTDPDVVLPVTGNPLVVTAVSGFFKTWDGQATCPNEFDPGIRTQPDGLTASLLQFDPLAATWGTKPVWRSPSFNPHFGWNSAAAAKLSMPVLLIRGDNDIQVPLKQVTDLFADVASESKVFVHVACAAHQLVWELQHTRLLDASVQWLTGGRYNGERNGCFAVDVNGTVTPAPNIAAPCSPTTGDDGNDGVGEDAIGDGEGAD